MEQRNDYAPQRQRCIVAWQIASYSGEETVYCDSDDENEVIIAKCKRLIKIKNGELPFGSQSFRVKEREDYFGE